MQDNSRSRLSIRFERFALECARLNSPFYERLSRFVVENDSLLELAAHASREPIPNAFFGAVHYLLLKGTRHELREYYPSLVPSPRDDERLFATFELFCHTYQREIASIIRSRIVQTNEVNRSAILAPAFAVVSELGQRRPLALVEVGASAGLNLLWDRYRIAYSDGTVLGDPQSTVRLECENRGAPFEEGMTAPIAVAERQGVDLNPIDLTNADERLWLQALVWPDHRERAARLEAAIAVAIVNPTRVERGDALHVLPRLLAEAYPDSTLCVYHSAVLYQFTGDERSEFEALLAAATRERPLWHVSAENEQGLRLLYYRGGQLVEERILAEFDAHGRWIDWRPR